MEQTISYDRKIFRPLINSENGETSDETIFNYRQEGNMVKATYSGGKIKFGHLIGLIDEFGNIDMRYHQINSNNELMTGICKSRPEVLPNGKIRLHETWQWTSGDNSKGTSIIEEI
ncbi:MAG: n-acetylglutamate synthase [Luteibaculaceae bacterium]